jgi:hypothetical protein
MFCGVRGLDACRYVCQNGGKWLVLEMLCKFGGDGVKSATLNLSKCVPECFAKCVPEWGMRAKKARRV